MKKKLITVAFAVTLILSIAGNIYLFNEKQANEKHFTSLADDIGNLNSSLAEKEQAVTQSEETIKELETTVTNLQKQLEELQTKAENTTIVNGYSVEAIEEITMYVSDKDGAPVHRGASDDYISDVTLQWSQEVKVTGKANEANWYEISLPDGTKGYVSGSLLQNTKPETTPTSTPDGGTTPTENSVPINPETGQPWKPGDKQHYNDGGSSTYQGTYYF